MKCENGNYIECKEVILVYNSRASSASFRSDNAFLCERNNFMDYFYFLNFEEIFYKLQNIIHFLVLFLKFKILVILFPELFWTAELKN